ncbi:transposase, partial [mine drainage metagenome]
MLWALHEKSGSQVPGRQVRLNLHYCIGTGNPAGLSVSGEHGVSEAQAILLAIVRDMIYVADRGIFSFAGVKDIVEGGAHFVFRLKSEVGFTCESENILTEKDRQHRVISDRIGYLTGSHRHPAPPIKVREILIYNPDNPGQPIRLLTDMLDQGAHIIGMIYLHR